jgi:hypothetical protein
LSLKADLKTTSLESSLTCTFPVITARVASSLPARTSSRISRREATVSIGSRDRSMPSRSLAASGLTDSVTL